MITLIKTNQELRVSDIEVYDTFVILIWGQYRRFLTMEQFNEYTVTYG